MTNPCTLLDLKNRVLGLFDEGSSAFYVPDDLLTSWINEGLGELHRLIIKENKDFFRSIKSYITTANVKQYQLPDDFYELSGVDAFINSYIYSVPRFTNSQRNYYSFNIIYPWLVGYELTGNFIVFQSFPTSQVQFNINYIRQFDLMSNNNSHIDQMIPKGWEKYVILYAAIYCKLKEESDPSFLEKQLDKISIDIKSDCKSRDSNLPVCLLPTNTYLNVPRFLGPATFRGM